MNHYILRYYTLFLLVITCVNGLQAKLQINELMQSNIDCIMDDINEFPDSWVELYNPTSQIISLHDYSIGLTNDPKETFQLPQLEVQAHGFCLIYCDKEADGLHTDFRLESGKNGALYLFKTDSLVDKFENIPNQPVPNVSYGRLTETSNQLGWLLTPTPKQPDCGMFATIVLESPVFYPMGSLITHSQPVTVTLSAPIGAPDGVEIRYTLDGTEPTVGSNVYSQPLSLSESSVVRARCFKDGCLSARSRTESYLRLDHVTTLPVVSIVVPPDYLYSDSIGIYVVGNDANNPNYAHDWRRPMNFEFFEKADSVAVLNQLCEARIHGNASRPSPLKSMAFYANKRFGEKRFNYEMFPIDRPGEKDYKSFILRDGGNDMYGLNMRDAIIQRAAAWNCDLDFQAYRAAVVFINGNYVGIENLRERSNEDNIRCNYDIDDIDVIKNNWEVSAGDNQNWWNFQTFYKQLGHTWDEYETWMDCQEYINMMVMELFFNNLDFPACNIVCWRPRTETNGCPSRWRWILKDCDIGMGFAKITPEWDIMAWLYNPEYSSYYSWGNTYNGTLLFRNLMTNDTFRKRFIDCAMVYMGDFLNGQNIWEQVWKNMYLEIKDEFPYHHALYLNNYPSGFDYQKEIDYTKHWLEERSWHFASSIAKQYELGTPCPIALYVDTADAISCTFNDVPFRNTAINTYYFPDKPITLHADCDAIWTVVTFAANDSTVTTAEGETCTFTLSDKNERVKVYVQPVVKADNLSSPHADVAVQGNKIMYNGHIYIRRNGWLYDLFGRPVSRSECH